MFVYFCVGFNDFMFAGRSLIDFTRQRKTFKTCKCKYRLDASVCNDKNRWNKDKCRCECRVKSSDKERCDKGFTWNPSNCNCECDKSCKVEDYLDFKNCKCRRKIFGELVEECNKNIDENEMIYNGVLNVSLSDYKCNSCTLYLVLFVVFFAAYALAVFLFFLLLFKKKYSKLLLLV